MVQWKCTKCGYIYDESLGDSSHSIAGGTRFEDLPESWVCPRCGASKSHFVKK